MTNQPTDELTIKDASHLKINTGDGVALCNETCEEIEMRSLRGMWGLKTIEYDLHQEFQTMLIIKTLYYTVYRIFF